MTKTTTDTCSACKHIKLYSAGKLVCVNRNCKKYGKEK